MSTVRPFIDASLLNFCSARRSLHRILNQYNHRAHVVLSSTLPYESTPSPSRRAALHSDTTPLVIVAHCLRSNDKRHSKVTLASGFALAVQSISENVVLTCAHSLEHVRSSTPFFGLGLIPVLTSTLVLCSFRFRPHPSLLQMSTLQL